MEPDAQQEVIDAMTDFIESEQEPDLDTIEAWRDKLVKAQEQVA